MAPSVQVDPSLLLKGYLPVRVRFPSSAAKDDDDEDNNDDEYETFFYVKEHQHKHPRTANKNDPDTAPPTLFVANAPSFPPIDTPTLLRALLGKFGNIARVTVVPNPRQTTSSTSSQQRPTQHTTTTTTDETLRTDWYFDTLNTDRFAHVVWETSKDLKRCLRALERIVKSHNDDALTVDAVERQTLADAARQQRHDDDHDDEDEDATTRTGGLAKVVATYRRHQRRRQRGRDRLLEECNAVMEDYEEAERARLRAISTEPDEDGFVTVTHATTQPPVAVMEDDDNDNNDDEETTPYRPQRPTKGGRSRHDHKKKRKRTSGATPKEDFYRFQTKAKRKHDVQELRQRFQQDLERIRQRKQQDGPGGGFQPFG